MYHKVSTDSSLAQAKDPESWGQPGLQCHCQSEPMETQRHGQQCVTRWVHDQGVVGGMGHATWAWVFFGSLVCWDAAAVCELKITNHMPLSPALRRLGPKDP